MSLALSALAHECDLVVASYLGVGWNVTAVRGGHEFIAAGRTLADAVGYVFESVQQLEDARRQAAYRDAYCN